MKLAIFAKFEKPKTWEIDNLRNLHILENLQHLENLKPKTCETYKLRNL